MFIKRFAVISILVLLTLTVNIQAQTPAVTASVTPDGNVRMIAHGEALQIRMEVYSAAGERHGQRLKRQSQPTNGGTDVTKRPASITDSEA